MHSSSSTIIYSYIAGCVCPYTAVDLLYYFPDLKAGCKLSEAELSLLRERLSDETTQMKVQFASLMFDVQKDLEANVETEDVISFLAFCDKTFATLLNDCTRTAQVFRKMINFTSFFDYDLLERLIVKFGSTPIKENLKEYKDCFATFSKRRVCECPNNAFGDSEDSEKVWVFKTDKIFGDLTVEEIKQLNYRINKILGEKVIRILRITKGCVEITYRILNLNIFDLTSEQQQALNKVGVTSISYGDFFIDISKSGNFDIPIALWSVCKIYSLFILYYSCIPACGNIM